MNNISHKADKLRHAKACIKFVYFCLISILNLYCMFAQHAGGFMALQELSVALDSLYSVRQFFLTLLCSFTSIKRGIIYI